MKIDIKAAARDVRLIFSHMAENPVMFSAFILLSFVAALSEGVSASLLVPVLEVQGNRTDVFSNVPLLKHVTWMFEGLDAVEKLQLVAVFLGVAIAARGALLFATQVMSLVIPISIQRRLTMMGYQALMRVDISYVHNHDVGDMTNAITSLPQRITIVLKYTADIISNLLILSIYSVLMLAISVEMTLVSLLVLGSLTLMLRSALMARVRALGRITSKANADLHQTTYETMNGMQQIRLSGAEQKFIDRFAQSYWDLQLILRKAQILGVIPGPAMMTAVGIFICGLLYWGAANFEGDAGQWTSQLLLFLFLLMRLLSPVTSIAQARTNILGNIAALHETHDFLAEVEHRQQANGTIPFKMLSDGIVLDKVSFRYEGGDEFALRDLSTTIRKGEMVAIVGSSGAGKSTLIHLLTRLYDPTAGRVLIDGVDLREYDITSWRKRIGVVSQDIAIFNDTVEANIQFGLEGVGRDEIRNAARLAAAEDFIENMDNGYNTVLGDRGTRLSGGQQQRIAIARAVLSDPDVLILDEGTSHLDTVTELAIQKAIEELSEDRTVMVVAHRLSTIRRANRIVVMADGQIIEEGTHDELVEAKGGYFNLLQHQRLDIIDDKADALKM